MSERPAPQRFTCKACGQEFARLKIGLYAGERPEPTKDLEHLDGRPWAESDPWQCDSCSSSDGPEWLARM